MLRVVISHSEDRLTIRLDGRIAGPWVDELAQAWRESRTLAAGRRTVIDLRNVTYATAEGTELLKEIFLQTRATILAATPWTHSLAQEIADKSSGVADMEGDHVPQGVNDEWL
jgi:hypothetical protein